MGTSRLFTVEDIGESIPVKGNAFERAYPVRIDAPREGYAVANPLEIGKVLGEGRVEEWIVEALNRRVLEVKRGVVEADLMAGFPIRDPVSKADLEPWDRLS